VALHSATDVTQTSSAIGVDNA